MTTIYKCTIHNIKFSCDKPADMEEQRFTAECPICSFQERQKLRKELDTLRGHRDCLLRAFEIKNTVELKP